MVFRHLIRPLGSWAAVIHRELLLALSLIRVSLCFETHDRGEKKTEIYNTSLLTGFADWASRAWGAISCVLWKNIPTLYGGKNVVKKTASGRVCVCVCLMKYFCGTQQSTI